MFSEEQIKLMKKIGLNLDFDNLSGDDWVVIEDAVGDYLTLKCLDSDYNPNDDGIICEKILDICGRPE